MAAICDECELLWLDIEAVSEDPSTPSDGAFPHCPECETENASWLPLSKDDLKSLDLEQYLAGESA